MSSMHGVLQTFDSWDNWELYSKVLQEYFASNCVPNDKRVLVLLAFLSPRVYRVLKESCHPDLPRLKTYGELSNLLKTHYSSEGYNSSEVFTKRVKLFQATQTDEESLNEWLSRITSLAADCEFDDRLESVLKDHFVSGLANREIMRKLCEETRTATLRHVVFLAGKLEAQISEKSSALEQKGPESMKKERSSNCRQIFDIPDEILIEILLYANARERAVLGNSSERFHSIVFQEKKLFRDLDFSYEGRLTSASYIQQYFANEDLTKYILRLNLRNVNCMEPGQMLNDYIGKALNLVDINIHGIELKDVWQLGSLLNPLIFVEKLSVNWPITKTDDDLDYDEFRQVLNNSFSRLRYLSVKTRYYRCLWEFSNPGKLEIFEFCGDCAWHFKKELLDLLPQPERWIEFGLFGPLDKKCFHLEKSIEICEELSESNCIEDLPDRREWTLGNQLRSECLLKAVLKITHEKDSEKFCLSQFYDDDQLQCVLKIEDAKLLLKNPRHQIKYLYLRDSIGIECKVHLFALAAPSLTELYLSDMMKIKMSTQKQTDSEEQTDLVTNSPRQSSFRRLVENTPLVQDLTLNGRVGELKLDEVWDLGSLCLIQGWKNLKSLRLLSIPISDGEFLIEISKQCKDLEKLEFYNLGPSRACCYTKELLLMLTHCQNLTDFSIHASNIGTVADLFVSLAKNLELRKVRLRSSGDTNDTVNLVSSVEQLLRRCSKLSTFVCIIDGISRADSDQLTSVLRGLRTELNRPSLQFQIVPTRKSEAVSKMDIVREDSVPPSFPYTCDEFSYL